MRLLTNVDVERLLTPADALGAVRAAFTELESGTAAIQARERTQVGDVKLTTLGAVLAGDGVLGAKVYSTVAGRFTFLVVLFAADDGRRLAVLESDALTRLRTAAASVLAAQLLARAAAKRLVVFGSGVPAQGHVSAFSDAFELETITVVSRSAGSPPLAWGHDGQPLTVTNDASTALAGADLVVTATRSMTPLFPCALLPDGTHVSAVGTSRPEARELDSEIYPRAAAVVVEWLPQAPPRSGRAHPGHRGRLVRLEPCRRAGRCARRPGGGSAVAGRRHRVPVSRHRPRRRRPRRPGLATVGGRRRWPHRRCPVTPVVASLLAVGVSAAGGRE